MMRSWMFVAGAGTKAAARVALLIFGLTAPAFALPVDKLPEAPLPSIGSEDAYFKALHEHVHKRWADNFLRLAAEKLPPNNPVNDLTRVAEAALAIGSFGQLTSVKLTQSSAFPGFDDAIIEVLRDSVPFPTPPASVRSDDDALHVRWVFARDQRRCSGITLVRAHDPLEIAIPKLLRNKREADILDRIAAARAAGTPLEPMMSALAQAWLKETLHGPSTSVRHARTLAEAGDGAALKWLQVAVKRFETAAAAGQALAASKVPICPLVKPFFDSQNWADHHFAALALNASGESECAPGLIALLQNPKAHPEARAAAATALGPISDESARKALAAASKDDTPPLVRAAAILAGVRPRAGRGKVIAMVSVLRDPSPHVRAAAAAGIVRAGGDSNLGDLYVVFKDDDPKPAEMVARELEFLPTEESTKLLVRLLRRPHLSVQLPAARILVDRRAVPWFGALKPFLDPKTDPQLYALALVAADPATLARLAGDPKTGAAVYRAYLARGERDVAAAWLLSNATKLPPGEQAEAMVDWLATRSPSDVKPIVGTK